MGSSGPLGESREVLMQMGGAFPTGCKLPSCAAERPRAPRPPEQDRHALHDGEGEGCCEEGEGGGDRSWNLGDVERAAPPDGWVGRHALRIREGLSGRSSAAPCLSFPPSS